ncbi:hypothetical protein FHT44_004989 [Mycolicibacterium sp. BK634]|nr:hypothetical protein [Mycolicibacterium sp. BK634]
MSWTLPDGYRQQIALANYAPGPLNPPGFYDDIPILECGCSAEDCDGFACEE